MDAKRDRQRKSRVKYTRVYGFIRGGLRHSFVNIQAVWKFLCMCMCMCIYFIQKNLQATSVTWQRVAYKGSTDDL